ncbi:MAG: branched-chain amino acid ABC transporter permease [Acidimicrobiia bacterium]|nr:branched-chain amino acid ABC transporter permease [Acidimicrobiia bacterium]
MRGRPLLYVDYESEQSLFPTNAQKALVVIGALLAISVPFGIDPGMRFLASPGWLQLLVIALIFMIGAAGLNIITGMAGQVSLGHAFFMGIGAYTTAALSGSPTEALWGLELPMWLGVLAGGLIAAVVGIIVAPTAVRVRGLYLAIVTLGLVFIGQHIFRNWNQVAGIPELGRDWGPFQLALWDIDGPRIDMETDGEWFGVFIPSEGKSFLFMLVVTAIFLLAAKNLARTRIGRSFAAIRDRDIAAEVMGVNESRAKTQAFAISSFYAGVAGALYATFLGFLPPEQWNLFLSVQFIAIVLIGGAGTVIGVVLGTLFIQLLPRIVENSTDFLSHQIEAETWLAPLADIVIKTGSGDFGILSLEAAGAGLSIFQANTVIYGLLIAVFLIFEPLGLYGIWLRIRNYWKGWPFTY